MPNLFSGGKKRNRLKGGELGNLPRELSINEAERVETPDATTSPLPPSPPREANRKIDFAHLASGVSYHPEPPLGE